MRGCCVLDRLGWPKSCTTWSWVISSPTPQTKIQGVRVVLEGWGAYRSRTGRRYSEDTHYVRSSGSNAYKLPVAAFDEAWQGKAVIKE